MKRTSLLGGISGLAVLVVVGLMLRIRGESPLHAAELQPLASPVELGAEVDRVPSELPIPESVPSQVAASATRRPAKDPAEQDFEERYGKLSAEQRAWQANEVSERLKQAVSDRIDELHGQFGELRSRGEYFARVAPVDGNPFGKLRLHHKHGVQSDVSSARPAIRRDGSAEIHVLEFCPRTDPATCELFAELAWLKHEAP